MAEIHIYYTSLFDISRKISRQLRPVPLIIATLISLPIPYFTTIKELRTGIATVCLFQISLSLFLSASSSSPSSCSFSLSLSPSLPCASVYFTRVKKRHSSRKISGLPRGEVCPEIKLEPTLLLLPEDTYT